MEWGCITLWHTHAHVVLWECVCIMQNECVQNKIMCVSIRRHCYIHIWLMIFCDYWNSVPYASMIFILKGNVHTIKQFVTTPKISRYLPLVVSYAWVELQWRLPLKSNHLGYNGQKLMHAGLFWNNTNIVILYSIHFNIKSNQLIPDTLILATI